MTKEEKISPRKHMWKWGGYKENQDLAYSRLFYHVRQIMMEMKEKLKSLKKTNEKLCILGMFQESKKNHTPTT